MIPKYNTVSYSKTEKQNFPSAAEKQFQYACVLFYENSSNAATCTLKLQAINPSYLRN